MKYNPHTLQMVWLDLDDTLWNMTGNARTVLERMHADVDVIARSFASAPQWIEAYEQANKPLWVRYSAGEITRDYLRVERFAAPLRRAGVPEGRADASARILDPLYLDMLGRESGMVSGARELLDYLAGRGYRLGIVSNGFREVQYRKMESAGISGCFDCVVLSDDTGVNKPDRRFFDAALAKAGVTAAGSIVIGDNQATDIAGALRAGWADALWFNPSGEPWASGDPAPVHTVATLAELRGIL